MILFSFQFTLFVVAKEVFPVMVKDALTTSHPVSTPIATPDDIAESFDSISYSKVYIFISCKILISLHDH